MRNVIVKLRLYQSLGFQNQENHQHTEQEQEKDNMIILKYPLALTNDSSVITCIFQSLLN